LVKHKDFNSVCRYFCCRNRGITCTGDQ